MTAPSTGDAPACRPIIFSGESVRAILAGKKTQTRRVIAEHERIGYPADEIVRATPEEFETVGAGTFGWRCPYGRPGDTLWVRETWAKAGEVGDEIEYRADNPDPLGARWRPSIHMPRWASRITLEIEAVGVQRLQEITDWQILAEGMPAVSMPVGCPLALAWFKEQWAIINGKRAPWASNPWTWTITFRRLKP